ncbi:MULTISPECIES: DNA polymerase/3'-5' exonuclease PolX [unclassified Peribacillus]|uniref:DNA polymerase/3'-5' exonuclease PolX n=1 Tax=unclassified Peribacillus TaxID=2675266 RepID=UPI001914750F|nr:MULTISPECIES: DNA polymerase/3'-5' exonuclease PolX [unclassified Peribacillus]MBK5442865.1 DNA polymerase/3'-5' exonuclease PolX [Peribacillus sp. TH24]MBK5462396.1 DNA polymerase/3'-5' exonuclease PolX [Peribacillus sp. TH27]MBK5484267.1 DNA polymerase/3'-5' exonuclease PolX [Peribacillus sp. TH16]MBK5500546.1 DNA polymerase/3'-5' exonuclease PolX [Peribacillus sp. TH14]
MTVNKKDIIKLLEKIAIYMELKGENPFKVSAFRKAAGALETDDRSLTAIEDFTTLSGIGKGTAAVIEEYINEGKSTVLEELQEQVPKGLIPLLQLQGLGGKKIAKLHKELHINDVNDLKLACEEGKVAALSGFGKKTEEKILSAIAEAGSRPDRLPLAFMRPIADDIELAITNMEYIIRSSRAGSIRRMRETIKDLDFIISTDHPEAVKDQLLSLSGIKQVIAAGDTKVSVVLDYEYDISVDFRIVKDKEFITTLHHFTGSKDHNVRMRQLAKDRGEKISEYGVEVAETGEVLTFETEELFYNHFGLPFIPPELREDGTEVEQYDADEPLISVEDIQGDLHMHTTWSDGAYSIEEMIEACRAKGYKYMAITDHSQYLKVANGLTVERLREQKQIIHDLNEKYDDFTVLSGIEMDILPDGTLDYDDELLAEMDLVIASIHSSFSQPRDTIMDRLKTALNNPHVDIIAHPTGRIIGKRTGYDVDIDMLIELALETNTALELNANPNRLDLAPPHLRKAQEAGVPIVINTDAHSIDMLEHMPVGVSSAKKGWIKKSTVLNAKNTDGLLTFLKRND